MSVKAKTIAILVDNYFEQAEYESPLNFLKENGAQVKVITLSKLDIQGLNHIEPGDDFKAAELLKDVNFEQFDGLVLPGGVVNSDSLRMAERAQEWVNYCMDEGKLIAAICHAPWLLVSADTVEGRRLTSWPSLQDDIRNAGGEWIDQPVVVDANLITSRQPDDLNYFNGAIKTWFDETS